MEQRVSARLGRAWQVARAQDMADFASHPAAIFTDGTYEVFVKLYEGEIARDQLKQELVGLQTLTALAGVLTPVVIDNLQIGDASLAVMEAVRPVEREPMRWRQIGHALARIHAIKGDRFGFDQHGYWGSLYQDNTWHADWPSFFWERRIAPRLRAAVDSGHLPHELIPQVEQLGARLEELCGPAVAPSLLHGDAHQNNFISTAQGPVMIDPAVYYGHPEIDLAMLDFFAPVPAELLMGYREVAPLDVGFVRRQSLWLIPAWLAMVEVDGPQHVGSLIAALRHYL
jgi:protein-ribulosamine 3-kinase